MLDTEDVGQGGKRPGAGRPPIGKVPMSGQYPIRCTHAERVAWERAAKVNGKDLSEWIRDTLNASAQVRG